MLAAALALLAWSLAAHAGPEDKTGDDARVHRAAAQLVRTQLPSGHFVYRHDLRSDDLVDTAEMDGLSLTRQAFAGFALARYLRVSGDAEARRSSEAFLESLAAGSLPIGKGHVQAALERAGLYDRWQLWSVLPGPLDALGLLYDPYGDGAVVSPNGAYGTVYPGATALALLAGLEYRRRTGDARFDDALGRWARGLMALHVPGRGFRESPAYLSESHYLNPQGWLALASFSEAFPEEAAVDEVVEALDRYFLERYGSRHTEGFFHWGAMAAALRAEQTGDPRFEEFLHLLASNLLADDRAPGLGPENSCHLAEGLGTFVGYMQRQGRGGSPLAARARTTVEAMMERNRRLQVGPSLPAGLAARGEDPERAGAYDGAFRESLSSPVVRVDYTGHCLNALLIVAETGARSTE